MNRITLKFQQLRAEGRCGAIAYVTCGDPDVATTVRIVRELERAGADAIELGVPFSDPIADGPVIQAASQRALERGTTIESLFAIARDLRTGSELPLIAFSYLNPILRFGVERFATEAANAGIDSLLLTDLPPDASREIARTLRAAGVGLIFLLAPTSRPERVKLVDRATDGFIYYVSTAGVTGTRQHLDSMLVERLRDVRGIVKHPLAVGFGISSPEHYRQLSAHCDAVIVGSAIVRAIAAGPPSAAPERAASVLRHILS